MGGELTVPRLPVLVLLCGEAANSLLVALVDDEAAANEWLVVDEMVADELEGLDDELGYMGK